MVKKSCIQKPQPNTYLTAVKNDLVLSSDRCRISLGSNTRIGSLGEKLPVAKSLDTVKNDQREVKCIAGKIDRVKDSDKADDEEYPRKVNQNETLECSEYSVDGNSDKLTSFCDNDAETRTRDSLLHSTCLCCSQSSFHSNYPTKPLLGISNLNDAAAQKIPAQGGQSCSVGSQDFDCVLCGPAFNQCYAFNSEVGQKLSDKADLLSSANSCHIDMVLDQLFEESLKAGWLKEKQDIINYSLHLPQNMQHVSENDTSQVKLDFTVESCTPDLKPSVREKSFSISNSTHVKSRNVKLDEHNRKRPVLSAVTKGDYSKVYDKTSSCYDSDTYNGSCRRKGQNSFLYQKREEVNRTRDTGSVGDLQPSVRVRKQSLFQKRESTLQSSSACNDRNELNSDEVQAHDAEKCLGLKEADTNKADIVDNEGLGEYMSENVCNECDSSESVQSMEKRRIKSLRKQGQRVMCGTLVNNINAQESHSTEVSNRRRCSKSLEEFDCHGNNSSEYQEQLFLKIDKEETNSQSETKLSNTFLSLIDRKNGTLSLENVSESHRHKNNDQLSESETKRKRFNSGPDLARKRAKHASGEFVLGTTENLSMKTKFSWGRNRVKLKNKHRSKRVSKDKTEHTVIHDIHKTIAESSNVGAKVTVGVLNEADDSETVRVADLENIIPLDVLSCDNVGKRKVRLKQQKAKGALYRQVSSDGIWRSVNSKY